MKVHANIDIGGYTWAKYGFSTTYEGKINNVIEKSRRTLKGNNLIDFNEWYQSSKNNSFFI
jgi:hypothetical protein